MDIILNKTEQWFNVRYFHIIEEDFYVILLRNIHVHVSVSVDLISIVCELSLIKANHWRVLFARISS
jgi:hypothetical protein